MAHVLVADDEPDLRTLIARALVGAGHTVTLAADGAEALDHLERERGAFDLLLTDIKMPIMDGIALALAAARDAPSMPILLMTGYADQRERAADLAGLIQGVLGKPFSVAEVCDAVESALKAGRP